MTVQPIVALDLGATKVACAIGLPHEHAQGFELLGSSLVPYRMLTDTWLGDPLMVGQAIEQALEATGVKGDFHRALVAMSHPTLGSEHVRTAITLGDEPVIIRAQDLDRLKTSALTQALGIDREPLMVERLSCAGNGFDGVREPRGLSATRVTGTFHLITMPMAVRRALIQAVESAGLEVARLTYTLPAVWAGVSDEALTQRRGLLVDVGGLTIDIGLFVEGVLCESRTLPWGGLTLAEAIAKELRVTMDQAMTWSLEGTACRKGEVRRLIEDRWASIPQAVDEMIQGQPRPDAILVSGRGGLIDGLVEWVERATKIPASLGRNHRLSRLNDLSQQIGLNAAIGLLELATRVKEGQALRSSRLVDRLIDRTRTILTEYF